MTIDSSANTPKIGIWGPSQSGKTTYLAALKLAIDKFPTGWRMAAHPEDEAARKFLETETAGLSKASMPAPTESAEPLAYTFQMEHKAQSIWGRDGRFHELTIFDAAGRLILRQQEAEATAFFNKLAECKGLLLMIDPDINRETGQPGPDSDNNYLEGLIRLYNQMRAQPDKSLTTLTVDISIALCVTKVDDESIWPEFRGPIFNQNAERYVRALLGEVAFQNVNNYYTSVKCFAVSAVGRYIDPEGHSRPNIEEVRDAEGSMKTQISDLDQWQPYRLLDPLMWLFDEAEARHRRELLPLWRRLIQDKMRIPNLLPEVRHGG